MKLPFVTLSVFFSLLQLIVRSVNSPILFLSVILLLQSTYSVSQNKGTVTGIITDENNTPMYSVNVAIMEFPSAGTSSVTDGSYELSVPLNMHISIYYSFIGYATEERKIIVENTEPVVINVQMKRTVKQIGEFSISAEKNRTTTMNKIDPKLISVLPSATGNFESILFSQPGVVSNNELSSQYSVRGGNFDENLVYVNGIEIYRPFLIRSGQQEGLSFTNPDLVESVSFSAGGFESKYGDKMASVLDITYKEPKKFAASFAGSLLGGSVHVEDASKDYRFTQVHGIRYFTNQYLLGSLNTQGSYKPSFTDYQSYITYDLTEKLELGFLTNVSTNKYWFVPETRQTDFGTISQALRLTIFFEGQEIDKFTTLFGAFNANYKPDKSLTLRFISSSFRTIESQTYDILGQYRIDELENDLSKSNFGDVKFNRGVGSFLDHGRDKLDALVYNFEHKGEKQFTDNTLLWGIKYQREDIIDKYHEWKMIDSAGYSLPQSPPDKIILSELYSADNTVSSNRFISYVQENKSFLLEDSTEITFSAGLRANYWSFNRETVWGPRANLSYKPNWKKDFLFKAAWGYYHQPAFYREMRNLQGEINSNIKAQTSIHYVLASDYNFFAWNRPFKFITELYYKQYKNLIPYEIDNVRIRYYATNNSVGNAMGIDMKVNGEFVRGMESWASLSVMQVKEDLVDDYYYIRYNSSGEKIIPGFTSDQIATDSLKITPGYVPRPTDQRVNFGLFFQDYIPKHPNYKMHLNLLFGSGLPTGPPSFERYKDTLRLPPYRRVDIGFSMQLLDENKKLPEKNPFRHFRSIWLSMEIFNLLQTNNTISYLWIKDITNRQYAVPNYLTARRLNLKLIFRI